MNFVKFFILVMLVILTAACSKRVDAITETKSQDNRQANDTTVTGTWQWVRTDGGIAYNIHETPASTGKQIHLKLLSNLTYTYTTNGVVTSEGTYALHIRPNITTIDFSADPDIILERVNGKELLLSDGIADGVMFLYERLESDIK